MDQMTVAIRPTIRAAPTKDPRTKLIEDIII